MKITIIKDDARVYIDGVSYGGIDMASVPPDVHALQWKGEAGWIEFCDNDDGSKPQNEAITELPEWANDAVAAWEVKKADEEAAAAAAADAQSENNP